MGMYPINREVKFLKILLKSKNTAESPAHVVKKPWWYLL